jgi:deoxyribonucleoside regulator
MALQDNRLFLLGRVARMYYEDGATQEAIATELKLSRPTVSRLLKEAREEGVVQIIIRHPLRFVPVLENEIRAAFPYLRRVIVVAPPTEAMASPELTAQGVARAAADYISSVVESGDIVGVSWGNTMEMLTLHLPQKPVRRATVVQLNGGVSRAATGTNAQEVAQRFGRAFGAQVYYLTVPAIVDSAGLREALQQNRETASLLDLGRRANIAVYGIGVPGPNSVLVQAGYITPRQVESLRRSGARGDICSRFFTADGTVCDRELDDRTIGLPLRELGAKEHAVAVVPGKHRAAGLLGALRGRYLNVLVTDEETAAEVLTLHGGEERIQ